MAARLTAGEVDVLGPLAEQRHATMKSRPCPRCGGAMHPELNSATPFVQHDPLPQTLAKCVDCGHTYDPMSGIVISNGNPAKVEDPFDISGSRQ